MAYDTLDTAKDVSLTSSAQTFTNSISRVDSTDYYRFQLKSYGSVSAVLNHLGGDVNLELIQDRDRNGTVSSSEVLAASKNSGAIDELINTILAPGTYYLRVSTNQDSDHYSLNVSATSDLKTNLVWRNSITGENAAWQVKDTTVASAAFLTQVTDSNWKLETTADFNQDGQADLIWRNYASGENAVWQMKGNAIDSVVWLPKLADANWKIAGVADFNNDGQADLIWRNSVSGENAVWQMKGNAIDSGIFLTKLADANWKIAGVADFNNDGQADLIWRNYATGENAVWQMKGSTIDSGIYLTKVAGANWKIAGVADFNNDGQADLIWRNYTTGENAVWQMKGNAIDSAVWLLKIPDLNWQLVSVSKQFDQTLTNDAVGNTIADALDIGMLTEKATFRESLGLSGDREDNYQFTLSKNSSLTLTLTDLSANVDLQLLDSKGAVIQISATVGNAAESISSGLLSAGTYYVRLYSNGNDFTNYTLNLSAALPVYQYGFTYYYNGLNNSKDYYTGYVYSYSDAYSVGEWTDPTSENNATSCNGKYLIQSAIAAGNISDVGKVFVEHYQNSENSTSYTPVYFGQGKPSGTNSLGSEYDFIGNSNSADNGFGLDKWVYDVIYSKYNFTYYYNGKDNTTDYYTGWVYAQPGTYTIASFVDPNPTPNETGSDGKYLVTASSRDGTAADVGNVFVDRYYDIDNSQSVYTPFNFSQGKASGTSFLGSEYDYASSQPSTQTDFGQDAWEFDAKPELSGAFFDVAQASLISGDSLTANFRIKNTGADARPFQVAIYLSKDQTITSSDRLLGTYDVGAIAANSLSATLSKILTLPGYADSFWGGGGTSNYYVGMIVDSLSVVSEANETNNANQGSGLDEDTVSINVVLPQPDLKGSFFSTEKSFAAGGSFTANFQVQNLGTDNARAFRVGFYLSSDSTITTSDRAIGFYDLSTLQKGTATGVLNSTLVLPGMGDAFWQGNRTYYIGMVVDALNTITESSEANNANQGKGIDSNEVFIASTITKPVVNYGAASGNSLIDALWNPNHAYWNTSANGGVIPYSFYTAASGSYTGTETVSEVSSLIKANVRLILASIESFINVRFVEVADTTTSCGVIRYLSSNGKSSANSAAYNFYAYAYYPGDEIGGDVHLNSNNATSFEQGPGSYGYTALLHETLHALGLKHPGNYNAGGSTTEGPFLSPSDDNLTNTVMTYNNGTSDTQYYGSKAITLMSYDIRALQYLYGARDKNANSTTYAFSTAYGYAVGNQFFGSTTTELKQSIWDAGGVDTLDFSGLSAASSYRFDLNPGGILTTQSSYNGSTYYDYSQDSQPNDGVPQGSQYVTSNFGTTIAYGTVIENLINSRGNDDIIANAANNVFKGYTFGTSTGNDVIESSSGADVIELSGYTLSNLTTAVSGSNLTIGLGSYGSIQLQNYYSANGSLKFLVSGTYYTYNSGSWQAVTAPAAIAPPSPDGIVAAGGLTATVASTSGIPSPSQVPAACMCPLCSGKATLNQLGTSSLVGAIGLS